MVNVPNVIRQIQADQHNIQELIDMLPLCETKGAYRSTAALIKVLVKEIRQQKALINDKITESKLKFDVPLFEVELPEPEIDYSEMDSFFGYID